MNGFIRKMCILKQLKKGFSADGSPLGGVARAETFAGSVSLQISLINFAPLAEGRYVGVLCDKGGERIVFPLSPGANEYHTKNETFDIERGFCCLVCFLFRGNAECLAGGQYGGGSYSMKLLLNGLKDEPKNQAPMSEDKPPVSETRQIVYEQKNEERREGYDDERICETNYYAESGISASATKDDDFEKRGEEAPTDGQATDRDENDTYQESSDLFARENGQSYYLSVKDELEKLFAVGRKSHALKDALPNSEWVEVKEANGCLIGQIYEELQVRYIAYALPAREKTLPEGMEKACYIPTDPVHPTKGYYVLFQSAATGECVEAKQR